MVFLKLELRMGLAVGTVTPEKRLCDGRGLCLGVLVRLCDVACVLCGAMHDSVSPGL